MNASYSEVDGPPVSAVEGVLTDEQTGAVHYAVSDTGTLAYVEGEVWAPENRVLAVRSSGEGETLLTDERAFGVPRCLPMALGLR